MNSKLRAVLTTAGGIGLGLVVIVAVGSYLHGHHVAVFTPQGPVATKERNLIYCALALAVMVVVPVFVMLFWFSWRYREGNPKGKAKYRPEWDHSNKAEAVWWLVPLALITVLSVVAWNSSHALDPFKPLASTTKPLTVQVIALDWKWLFIYPEQNIASVNYFQMPTDTPVNFEITADAPMNSFWIPQLGGQIYAMPGMSTHLSLMADHPGDYRGSSANLSGEGFAGMDFTVHAGSQADFLAWVKTVKQSPSVLTQQTYAALAEPSRNNPVSYYSSEQVYLYDTVVEKYTPATQIR